MPAKRCETELSSGTLSYLEWGQGSPLLCLHGLGDQGLVWQSLGEHLADQYSCIAPDLPGHGDSAKPKPPECYLSTALVTALEELAQAHHWTDLEVVAHSWSAKLALMWATLHPTRIQRLILVDPFFVNRFPIFLKPTLPILYRVLPFLKMLGPFPSRDAAENVAKTLKQYQGWSQQQQDIFQASIEQKADGSWGSKFTIEARNGVFLDTFTQSGLTKTLPLQTHILLPKSGLNRRPWQLKPYQQYLTQPVFTQVPGNHWPHLVEPQALNQKVAEILLGAEG